MEESGEGAETRVFDAGEGAPDYVALGHVTADRLPGGDLRLGGSVAYACHTATRLGWRAGLVTRAAAGWLTPARLPGVSLRVGPSYVTTCFSNRYDAEGKREQVLHARGAPLRAGDLPADWRRPRVLHLAPVAGELPSDVLEGVEADLVGLTPQGWLRAPRPDGVVEHRDWAVPSALARRADVIVLSDEDIRAVAGGERALAEDLVTRTCVLIITLGPGGARAYSQSGMLSQAALDLPSVDPTGAGDVFAASFFIRYWETRDLRTALRFATRAAGLSVGAEGMAGIPDRATVERQSGPSLTTGDRIKW